MNKKLRKILIFVLSLVLVLSGCTVAVTALSGMTQVFAAQDGGPDTVKKYIDDIWDAQMEASGSKSLQELVWHCADTAGGGEEWFIISLRQRYPGQLDLSEYRCAYEKYVSENTKANASSRLKSALTLQAIGGSPELINRLTEESIGELGIMSYIYGLHVVTNGAKCSKYSAEQIIDVLLGMQLEDGGWAVMGDGGDVDVTAMAVQALAPFRSKNEKAQAAGEKAVDLLSQRQRDDGTFISFGEANAESTAQVLLAMACMGIAYDEDERFIKDGATVLDVLESFCTGPGVYEHSRGTGSNYSATLQALYALTGYEMMLKGSGSLFEFGEFTEPHVERPTAPESKNIKPLLYGIVAAAALIACAVLALLKKRSYKSYLFVVILAVIAALGVRFINVAKPSDYYGRDDTPITDPVRTTISIRCDTVAGEKSYIPKNGVILDKTEITMNKGQTAYDQLISAVKANSIQIDVSGGSYVSGIANIYEMDFGDLSGWMYRVNGKFADVNCNEYKLGEGDFVEWLYTKNIGKDIGEDYSGDK